MTVVKSDLQKLETLLNSATNERQRKMYQSLLDKARQNAALQESALNSEQAAESKIDSVDSLTLASSIKQQKQSEPKEEEQVLSSATAKERDRTNDVAHKGSGNLPTDPKEIAQKQTLSEAGKQFKSSQPTIFQAVGLIRCTPQIEGDRLIVAIDDRDYELKKGSGRWRKQFDELKQEIEQHGSTEMLLRVYPNIIHDSKNQEIRYWFTLVRAYFDESQCSDNREDFIFRGIWNIVPYCDEPVISIHRNINTLGFYQRLSFKAKKAFIRPQAFPVVWDAPVEPFVYDPKLEKSEQMPRYFVEVRATFDDGRYTVVEMLNEPTKEIPKYIKSMKKNQDT